MKSPATKILPSGCIATAYTILPFTPEIPEIPAPPILKLVSIPPSGNNLAILLRFETPLNWENWPTKIILLSDWTAKSCVGTTPFEPEE